ncbi:beta-1,3-galactosyltransferase 2-like isoform X3 [Echeneis naucrates]|uniref:beta-1,3-galactosyltransferase 2-like isoform X3 n=1 Tax=Echeneis naucrates TaxID=173247 RepID=UPI001113ED75|nr:beta-1,3-galactosyltransferase 2-like isoform X3 [Echeneis naucrates]
MSNCGKTLWMPRCWLCLLMLCLVLGTMTYIFKSSSIEVSRPVNIWRTTAMLSQENRTTAVGSYFVAYPHQYHFMLDEPHRCLQEKPFVILMIPVAPSNREAREMIRTTWGKETTVLGQVVSHYFLLGVSKDRDVHLEEEVLEESRTHQDILQSNFVDSYNNLTIKTMVMFEWLSSRCPNASYAMKIDSDIFLNVQKLVGMLLKAPQHLYMTGRLERDAAVLRDRTSKWFLPLSVFPESTYPIYPRGLGYVFSLDLPQKIMEASSHIKALFIEDVYVGLCMRHLGITLTDPPHNALFMDTMPYSSPSNCYWTTVITTILDSSKQLLDVWGMYQSQRQSGC